jgi:hypothetical protein
MTNHAQTMVYTTYMSPFYRLIATLALFTLPSFYSWGQAENTTAPAAEETTPPEETIKTPPLRLNSRVYRPTYPLNTQHHMQLLASQLEDKKAIQWLTAGEETFLAIWQADRSGDAKGAVLIIHAEGEHPAWPQTTKPLHDSLPDYGWATMAIHLPNPLSPSSPRRTIETKVVQKKIETPENDAETSTDEKNTEDPVKKQTEDNASSNSVAPTPTPTEEPQPPTTKIAIDTELSTEQRLVSALQFLHGKGQFNIVIMGSGIGAIRSHKFIKSITPVITNKALKDKLEKPIRASIIFNARNQLPNKNEEYQDWFFDPEIPVLDIYTASDPRNRKEARARKILGKQEKAITHSQIKIAEITYEKSWGENQLSRRIRSFLDAFLQGIEIDKKRIK